MMSIDELKKALVGQPERVVRERLGEPTQKTPSAWIYAEHLGPDGATKHIIIHFAHGIVESVESDVSEPDYEPMR